MVKAIDSSDLNSYNKRRCSRRGFGLRSKDELTTVVRNHHSQKENAKNVEEEDSVECESNGFRHGFPRVLSLAHSDSNKLCAQECINTI